MQRKSKWIFENKLNEMVLLTIEKSPSAAISEPQGESNQLRGRE
jgi:hypothetical protein